MYYKQINVIGSDEVGSGDYFGPLVVAAFYIKDEKDLEYLRSLGINDSKLLNNKRIQEIGKVILQQFNDLYALIIIDNLTYNKLISSGINQNSIKVFAHNKAILSLCNKFRFSEFHFPLIVIDEFTTKERYLAYLSALKETGDIKREVLVKNMQFEQGAESKIAAVAAASIVARYFFLREIKRIEKENGIVLPLGAGEPVEKALKKIFTSSSEKKEVIIESVLKKIAKVHFRTTEKILFDIQK